MPALHPPSASAAASAFAPASVPAFASAPASAPAFAHAFASVPASASAMRGARSPASARHGARAPAPGDPPATFAAPSTQAGPARLPWELDDPDEVAREREADDSREWDAAGSVARDAGASAGRNVGASAGRDAGASAGRNVGAFAGRDAGASAGRNVGAFAERDAGAIVERDAGTFAGRDAGAFAGRDAGAFIERDAAGSAEGIGNLASSEAQQSDDVSAPTARPSRLRIGVGAAVVLVIVALVCAVLVSLFSGRGRTDLVAPGVGGPGIPASTASTAADSTTTSPTGSGNALPSTQPTAPPPGSATTPVASPATGLILLHVLGAVTRPGLYELHTGDRVVDAVAAAGGFTPNADQTQQNLARIVTDGEQLVIPEQGAAPPLGSAAAGTAGLSPGTAPGPGAGSAASSGSPGTAGQPPPLVNLNTADQTLLETLPQVGPALAQRIIAWRTTNGRFTQLDDLKNVPGIGDKTFAALQPLVTL